MKRSVLLLTLLALPPSILAAPTGPVSIAVDQTCGVIVGKTRFNVGSQIDVWVATFGPPASKGSGVLPDSRSLIYPRQGLEVEYLTTTRKIVSITVDLKVSPRLSLSDGTRLDASPQVLSKRLGKINAELSTSFGMLYSSAACAVLTPGGSGRLNEVTIFTEEIE